ncbi:hypothetical protein BH11GEM2_BH11GEM2_38170 [soil metagenome]
MSYPAFFSFMQDGTLSASERRVYEYLYTILDLSEARAVPSDVLSGQCGISKPPFIKALTVLVAAWLPGRTRARLPRCPSLHPRPLHQPGTSAGRLRARRVKTLYTSERLRGIGGAIIRHGHEAPSLLVCPDATTSLSTGRA